MMLQKFVTILALVVAGALVVAVEGKQNILSNNNGVRISVLQ
jgi:hypothetical protein